MEVVPNKPEGAPIINIEGKRGESLFHRPLIWGIEKDLKLISGRYTEYERLVSEAEEERLLALIGAMSMEEVLDWFLGAYIPGYRSLEEDFSLSIKIRLARSLRIVPEHILGAAALINNVRNKFAHNLRISCFDALDNGTKDNLRQKRGVFFPNDINTDLTVKDMFVKVVDGVILGFEIYTSHVRIAREYIYSDDFVNELSKRIKGKPKKDSHKND